jgi:hypothetical protein
MCGKIFVKRNLPVKVRYRNGGLIFGRGTYNLVAKQLSIEGVSVCKLEEVSVCSGKLKPGKAGDEQF